MEAAIRVLADKGTRGFTHRATDEAAGVPAGTTSNYFRTRAALLRGAVRGLNDALITALNVAPAPHDATTIIARLAEGLDRATRPDATHPVVFFMLNYEAAANPAIAEVLSGGMLRLEQLLSTWLASAGSRSPERDAVLLGVHVRGLMINQRTLPAPDFDAQAALEPMVHGLLGVR